jgi:hypothetical protein
MLLITKNLDAIDLLSNQESLISGKLQKISMFYCENELIVELNVELLYSEKLKEVLLQFRGVSEYSFNYTSSHNFYYIEDYVLFKKEDMVYISLDPANPSEMTRNVDDNDFIVAEEIYLFQLKEKKQ